MKRTSIGVSRAVAIAAVILAMLIAMMPRAAYAATHQAGPMSPEVAQAYEQTADYLLSQEEMPHFGTSNGEWKILGLARAGLLPEDMKEAYYENMTSEIESLINDKQQLDRNKSTENSRAIFALAAIGKDPSSVKGHNLLEGLTDMDYVKYQGINGPVWALIAYNTRGYDIPACEEGKEQVTRDVLIEYILEEQDSEGGWALFGKADPDMTGMAIQALAPYYDSNEEVKAAIDKALTAISAVQRDDGGFSSWGTTNVESTAQMIVALTRLGIDPAADERFVKQGNTMFDALMMFSAEGGGFKHTLTGQVDQMATEQVFYALVSYDRLIKGKTSLYDMSDIDADVQMNKGEGGTWTADDKDKGLTFTSNADFKYFQKVLVDGKELAPENYTVESGSTVVTLKPEYLATLPYGNHTVSIVSQTGSAEASFFTAAAPAAKPEDEVTEPEPPAEEPPVTKEPPKSGQEPENSHTPKTGDESGLLLWTVVLAAAAVTGAVLYRKREQ